MRGVNCEYCAKTFSRPADLIRHQKSQHLKEHKCNICQKSFSVKEVLIKHMRTHNGERSFNCEYCDKTFTRPADLKRHHKQCHIEKEFPLN